MSRVVRVMGLRPTVPSRHLDLLLSAYADRRLSPADLLKCDRHVAICPGCRAAVDAESRMLSSLRTAKTPGLPSRLESALLDLAVHTNPAPPVVGPPPLALMRRSAPAMHRSPVRAAMLASLAAGASAAAAWTLGVGAPAPAAPSLTVVRLPSPAATARSTLGFGSGSLTASFLNVGAITVAGSSAGPSTILSTLSTGPVGVPAAQPLQHLPRVAEWTLRSAQSIHE